MQATSPSISYSIFDAPIENPSSWEEVHNIQDARFAKLGEHIISNYIFAIFGISWYRYDMQRETNKFVTKISCDADTFYYITPRLSRWSP